MGETVSSAMARVVPGNDANSDLVTDQMHTKITQSNG
jgi:hypothetical protein